MMSPEQNELISRTGPGTRCGALMRHYWHPVALAEELDGPRPAKAVHVLGEDFVLFRDERGRHGLLDRALPASRRRSRLWAAGRWRPALPVPWLAVRCRRQMPRNAGRTRGQRALPACAPALLSRRGQERHRLRLSRRRRSARFPRLRLLPGARHTCLRLQGADRLQLAAGARSRHRSGARLLPAPLLRGRGSLGRCLRQAVPRLVLGLRHPDVEDDARLSDGPPSTSRPPTSACGSTRCARSARRQRTCGSPTWCSPMPS